MDSEQTNNLPEWLKEAVCFYRDFFYLQGWEIVLKTEAIINGDIDVRGSCSIQGDINYAIVKFRSDIENTADWHKTIIHELLHIKHDELDFHIETLPEYVLNSDALAILQESYRRKMESYIQQMSDILYRAFQEKPSDVR